MNYPYANGRIAAIDNYILDRTKLAKLTKVSHNEFIPTLIELGYGQSANVGLEELINGEVLATKELLDELSPQKQFTDLFYFENDAINIKAMYKVKTFGFERPKFFKALGILSREQLEEAILMDNLAGLTADLQKLFKEINKEIIEIINPRLISAKIDNAIYNYLLRMLDKHRNPILKQYFQARIDIANILTVIRAKQLGWDVASCQEMLIDGGIIKQDVLISAYSLKNMNNVFTRYYDGRLDNGLKKFHESGNVNNLEMYFDEFILGLMSEYRYDGFTIGPIVYYFLKKQAEAKNIRLIYANDDIEVNSLLKY